ncbi:MAG TPA: hypothetical protein VNA27_14330 [Rubrobacteraceae bacterium]|nr:hypothetical protein [Rubrobacteraceae bacterium]
MVLDLGACSLLLYKLNSVFSAIFAAASFITISNYFTVRSAKAPTVLALTVFVELELGHCVYLLEENLAFGAVY